MLKQPMFSCHEFSYQPNPINRIMRKLLSLTLLIAIGICNVGCNPSSVTYHNSRINEFSTKTPDEIYAKGNKSFKRQEYEEALEIFGALIALHPFGPFAEDAQFKIIQCYKDMDQRKEALQQADKFIHLYPNSALVQQVWMLKFQVQLYEYYNELRNKPMIKKFGGDLSERDMHYLTPLLEHYDHFLESFPNSTYKAKVEDLKNTLYEKFAEYEYHIAKAYFNRKAYLAALKRATDLIKQFPDTPAAKRANLLKTQSEAILKSLPRESKHT